jgi:hypothetical protein
MLMKSLGYLLESETLAIAYTSSLSQSSTVIVEV